MSRKYIDCREFPSDTNCSVAIAADSEAELMEVAMQHAVKVHKHEDTPEFRKQLRKAIKDGTPPERVVVPGISKSGASKSGPRPHH